jgi:hypothetical protein
MQELHNKEEYALCALKFQTLDGCHTMVSSCEQKYFAWRGLGDQSTATQVEWIVKTLNEIKNDFTRYETTHREDIIALHKKVEEVNSKYLWALIIALGTVLLAVGKILAPAIVK